MPAWATAGPESRVNTYTTGEQKDSHVTALSDGGWLVTWTSDGQDGAKAVVSAMVDLEASVLVSSTN